METKEDLQKLTVVQLREKLKGRNLATTGTKSELVERLYENFQEEENLLSGSGANDDLDVDELLGTNLDEHSLTSKEEALLLGLNPKQKPSSEQPAAKPPATKVADPKPKPAASDVVVSPTEPKPVEKKVSTSTDAVRPQITTDNGSKMAERAKRFGVPLVSSESKTTEKKAVATPEAKKIAIGTDSKLAERAKRFGLPLQTSEEGGNEASKPKIPRVSVEVADEAKQRRMQRFGAK